MPTAVEVLTPEVRRLAKRAADRTLADLRAAIERRPGAAASSPRIARFASHVDGLGGPLRERLKARVSKIAATTPALPPPPAGTLRLPARLRAALQPAPQANTVIDQMKLVITDLHCVDDTRAVGADRMALGLIQTTVDTTEDPLKLETRVVSAVKLGKFRRGDREVFQPPKVLDTLSLSHAGRAVTTTFVLAEEDLGGLDLLLRDLAEEVSLDVVKQIAEGLLQLEGGALGATVLGTLGSLLGPAGTAAGITVGFAIGVAIGEGVYQALRGLTMFFADDLLDPITRTIDVPIAHPEPRRAAPIKEFPLTFTGAGGKYEANLRWIE